MASALLEATVGLGCSSSSSSSCRCCYCHYCYHCYDWIKVWIGFQFQFPCQMLQVRWLSGEEVSIPVEEIEDVRSLKRYLHQLRGLSRFRQRVLLHGETLEDSVKLESHQDLDLLLLTFAEPPKIDVSLEDLGSVSWLESILQKPQDPNASTGRRAFSLALEVTSKSSACCWKLQPMPIRRWQATTAVAML